MSVTLQDWYCLKKGRQNFKPNVRRDRDLIFCHDNEIEELAQLSIERSFAMGEPVKMMIYGNYGVGKTHAVHHISWWLEQHEEFSAKTVFVELGDITRRSNFSALVRPFLDEIGMDEIVRLISEYTVKTTTHPRDGLRAAGVGKDIVEAYYKFIMSPPGSTPVPLTEQAFEHLKGGVVKDAASSGLSNKLDQSSEFYDVLVAIGHLYKAVDDKQLIFIADEATKLEAVEADDVTNAHWENTNKLIFDDANTYFGFIYTYSASSTGAITRSLSAPQIENRLGSRNLIHLSSLSELELNSFLDRLVNSFVDKDEVKKLADKGELGGEYDPETYPFTASAKARFIEYWMRSPEISKPRDITDHLNDAAFNALKTNSRLINEDALEVAGL